MATWWDSVAVVVEFSPTTDPLDTPVWVDITDYVSVDGWETFRGRENEQDDVGVASMSLTLLNHDRRFDPDYTAGPYYNGGDGLLPMRRIRVRTAGVTVFSGHVLGWPQTFVHNDNLVRVEAVDGTRFNRNQPLGSSAYAVAVTDDAPAHYWPLQSNVADVVGSLDLVDAFGSSVQSNYPVGESLMVAAELDNGRADGLGASVGDARAVSFWMDLDGYDGTGGDIVGVWVSNGTTELQVYRDGEPLPTETGFQFRAFYSDATDGTASIVAPRSLSSGAHHVAVHATASTLTLIVDGVTVDTASVGSSASIASTGVTIHADNGARIGHVAVWTTAPTVAELAGHYLAGIDAYRGERTGERIDRVLDEVGWASADRDIATGETVCGPYRPGEQFALDVAQQCVTAEQGRLFHAADGKLTFLGRQELWARTSAATFTDDATNTTDVKYLSPLQAVGSDIEQISNTVTASWSNVNQAGTVIGGGITRIDTASAAAYGPSALTLDTPVIDTAANASALASWVLDQRADPATEIRHLTVEMRADVAVNVSTILGLELADLVTIERTLVETGADLEWTAEVAGIGHRMQGASWIVDLFLVRTIETATAVPLLEVGTDATYSTIGSTNKIGL